MRSKETFVNLKKVTKIYPFKQSLFSRIGKNVVALMSLDLEIQRGEIFGLVGESGSGKTTCGRLLVKLETPTSGTIQIDGEDILRLKGDTLKRFRKKVQMIFQDPYQSLNPQLTVFQTVAEPLQVQKLGNHREIEEKVEKTIEEVGLSPALDFLFRYPHQLSGGQRQRVAIARAMVLDPDFIVADEPVSMLDASIQAQLLNMLLDIRDRHRLTILFITHDLAAARYLCNRLAVIYKGHLMETGPAETVIQDPLHPYTKALLEAVPTATPGLLKKRTLCPVGQIKREAGPRGCVFCDRCTISSERCSAEKGGLVKVGKDHYVSCIQIN